MGSLERTLEENVARRGSDTKKDRRTSAADLPGEGSESEDGPVPEDEKGLEATPLATVDAIYGENDDTNDDILDLGFRVGKFRMTERLGGLFRPKLSEEMVFALVRDNKRGTEPEAPLKDDESTFLEPGPTFIAPGSGFMFGNTGVRNNITSFLPTRVVADLLMKRYHTNCHFVARVVHWPTFQNQYETFWASIHAGTLPPPSLQALFFSACFSAVASMSHSEIDSVFHQPQRQVLTNFQQATEIALANGHFLRTTKFETLQGLIIYLVPMCRGEISRAHSVLVGAAIRLGECFSLHRDPVEAFGYPPIEAHVRRLAWFQLCFLDFRTVEAQGPRPHVKREDYDTKMPWNIDDDELIALQPTTSNPVVQLQEKEGQWTDVTLSKIRFECAEMQRIVWHDRIRLDKGKVSITYCLSKIESFKNAMETKYKWLDVAIAIQHYARILLDLLLLRMHIMILHKFHNATTTRIPDRLRQIIINSGTKLSESAVKLDIDPKFNCFKWYSSALQQWHTAFLLIIEVFIFPNRKEADRIWSVIDHVFEPDLTLTRVQKARSILGAVRDRAAAYRDLRKMKEPLSMQNRLNTNLPPRARIRGPDMILPAGGQARQRVGIEVQAGYSTKDLEGLKTSTSDSHVQTPVPDQVGTTNTASSSDWNFDTPNTLFVRSHESPTTIPSRPGMSAKASPSHNGIQYSGDPTPSNSSHHTDSWPPSVTAVQQATYLYNQNSSSVSPAQFQMSPPQTSHSSPPLYGNSAMGLMSGAYMPQKQLDPARTRDIASQESGPQDGTSRLAMMGMVGSGILPINTWSSAQVFQNIQDVPMLDIDWTEWDKLFPIEMNNGELDMPTTNTEVETVY
ncbi:hypothetical protein LTS08_003768 [Lithohypha guttulata]|nr:hypothetical protein LTS08_003768 [Lithohypha guttulata]